MAALYILWRRRSLLAIGGNSNEAQEVCSLLTFPIQLFDDLFTDILFLSVEPFSALFVGMIVFYFVRDIIRDSGYGWEFLDWIRGKHELNVRIRCRDILLRYHLGEQNLFAELLAAVVVPTAVMCDYLFSKLGYGDDTIAKRLSSSEQIGILQMYGVLLCVELITHALVKHLLKRQLSACRALVESQSRSTQNNFTSSRSGRMSIIDTNIVWNSKSHNRKYWNKHFSYFMCMIAFTVVTVLFFSASLKHQLNK